VLVSGYLHSAPLTAWKSGATDIAETPQPKRGEDEDDPGWDLNGNGSNGHVCRAARSLGQTARRSCSGKLHVSWMAVPVSTAPACSFQGCVGMCRSRKRASTVPAPALRIQRARCSSAARPIRAASSERVCYGNAYRRETSRRTLTLNTAIA